MREIVQETKEWLIIEFSNINILIEEIKININNKKSNSIIIIKINFKKKYDKEYDDTELIPW